MKRHAALWLGWLLAGVLLPGAARAAADGVYLVPGSGVANVLRIGDRRPPAPGDGWRTERGLEYRTTGDGLVVLIRCGGPQCVTGQGIRVGSTVSEVLRRYGAPRRETRTQAGVYHEYAGVGFETDGGNVRSIYIFPRSLD